jgi:uncharacterized protein (TIGR00255 family)
MKSMTGFGRAERHVDGIDITVEVRSYNNRYLDVSVSVPQELNSVESALRALVAGRMSRGRVDLQIRMTGAITRPQVRTEGARAAADLLRGIARAAGVSEEVTVRDILDADRRLGLGVIDAPDRNDADPELRDGVLDAARCCLECLDGEREREGAELAADLDACLRRVEEEASRLTGLAAEWQERLERDVQMRMDRLLAADDVADRVVPAVALLLARADVNEELKRLGAHLNGMRDGMALARGPHGKKLEFYCQELLREANTIGAKASAADVDSHVLTVKENVERMREQLRNVE